MMTLDEAIRFLRVTPKYEDLVRDAYLGRDVAASAERFYRSIEFAELLHLLGSAVHNATVVDLGAGTGIASYAFLKSDARHVYAIEPDPSDEVGRGAIQRLSRDPTLEIIDAFADKLPLPDDSIDIFYCRQVLHHIPDLNAAMR